MEKEKIADLWNFETSDKFDEVERASLCFAMAAGQSPGQVKQCYYDVLRLYFSEKEIAEILFIICRFGFWNRWNDAVGIRLEETLKAFSKITLPDKYWALGKHAK